ncbi:MULTISPECIES: HPr kinase/phosphatase C-terminal domain-containing protein [unclassified Minwuia]|jgi:HPr kinase/phosphorylase|uniref:HPr kinase/phosphorylase n=1 Tax=unclassified Minwuia TaxID=2618799 RepID=UPI002478EBB6|nr:MULTISPECIES: HPr kinase/phosphatase C-terminal domain-containing protein [unclassified Minwuia]
MSETLHGTAVALDGAAVLLRGGSGAGKSDLALRLLAEGWQVIADDRVVLSVMGTELRATAPATLAGLLEVRGIGVVRLDDAQRLEAAPLRLVVDLVPSREEVPRMPEPEIFRHAGIGTLRVRLYPFDAAATARLAMALAVALNPHKRLE